MEFSGHIEMYPTFNSYISKLINFYLKTTKVLVARGKCTLISGLVGSFVKYNVICNIWTKSCFRYLNDKFESIKT